MADNKTQPTPKKPRRQVPEAEVATLIEKHFGNIAHVARVLGVNRSGLHDRINKSERLKQAVYDARQTMVDDAESALHAALIQKEGWAVCFTLKCLGKDRGYIERQEQEHAGSIEVIIRRADRK